MAAATSSTIFASSTQVFPGTRLVSQNNSSLSVSNTFASSFTGASLRKSPLSKKKSAKINVKVTAAVAVEPSPVEEVKDYVKPSWAMFEFGKAPVFWKTMNGLPPASGEKLKIFYNPAANNLVPNEEFGVGFNGGFNQPIMCGGEPRAMLEKSRGQNDSPFYTIMICVPKHAMNLIFSFTNGVDWDGPYRIEFQVPKAWRNKPADFFNNGLAEELSQDGACDRAIFPDTDIVVTRCAMVGNLSVQGGDRCDLNLVPGCMDTGSHLYNPLANVDDGSCLIDTDSED